MFLDELTPIFREMSQHPMAFMGGFFSGIFRLNMYDDPVKSWLDQQTGVSTYTTPNNGNGNGKSNAPQSISIDQGDTSINNN